MNRRIVYAAWFILLAAMSSSFAEELLPHGENRFITRKTVIAEPVRGDTSFIIQSVLSLSGRLYIIADDTDSMSFEYRKVLKSPRESTAHDYAAAVSVLIEDGPEGMKLLLQAPNPAPWSGRENSAIIEGELHLPEGSRVFLSADYFDVIVEGPLAALENETSLGRIEAGRITEKLNLTTSSRDIVVSNIAGEIALETSSAEIRITDMRAIDKPAYIRNQNGDISLNHCAGGLDVRTQYGKIKGSELIFTNAKVRIDGSYSPIRLKVDSLENADVVISNINEDIDLLLPNEVSADFRLEVGVDSEIDVEDLLFRPTAVNERWLEFKTGSGESDISVEVQGIGNILIAGKRR